MTGRTRTLLVALAATPTVGGCGDGPLAAPPGALVGTWRTRSEGVQPRGSWQTTLVVHPDMRVENQGVMYGLYPGDGPQTVSASATLYGRMGASAARFVLHPDSLVTTDRFYGPDYRTVEYDFRPWPADSTSYAIRGDVLTLTYLSSPADAPVPTTAVYHRVR